MKFGTCRLCGEENLLSFEHVPPRVTFNDMTVVEKDFTDYIGPGSQDWDLPADARGRQQQGGNGGHWLCRDCNSYLGREFVPHYADFVHQVVEGKPDDQGVVQVKACIKRFMKQVMGMFCAANAGGPEWPDVVRFVREEDCCQLPKKYRIFMFRCWGPSIHIYGFQAWLDLKRPGRGPTMISEITHTPMGFHLLYGHEGAHNPRMIEVTDWLQYGINDVYDLGLVVPVLPTFSPMFNDFRTPDEMRQDRVYNESCTNLKDMGWWMPDS